MDPTANRPQDRVTQDAIAIWQAGVEAVKADRVVEQQIHWDGRWLSIAEDVWDLKNTDQLIVVGAGKATAGMLSGLYCALVRSQKNHPVISGWVNVPQGSEKPHGPLENAVTVCEARPQGCNEPTSTVVDGTRQILSHLRGAGRCSP